MCTKQNQYVENVFKVSDLYCSRSVLSSKWMDLAKASLYGLWCLKRFTENNYVVTVGLSTGPNLSSVSA